MAALRHSLTSVVRCGVLGCCFVFTTFAFAGERAPLPRLMPGSTLPVSLEHGLDAKHVRVGQRISARLSQRVPAADGRYLSAKTRLSGTVTAYDGQSLALRFTNLSLGEQSQPVEVRLIAAAQWLDADHARDPLGATDRGDSSPADWTTMQIGRDEVYRSGGSGTVYDQYSQPVGHADLEGVYAAPAAPGALPRAMGPFSTTSSGLYDLSELRIVSAGGSGQPIVLGVNSTRWQLQTATALLLELVDK